MFLGDTISLHRKRGVMVMVVLKMPYNFVPQGNTQDKQGRNNGSQNNIDTQICHDVPPLQIFLQK